MSFKVSCETAKKGVFDFPIDDSPLIFVNVDNKSFEMKEKRYHKISHKKICKLITNFVNS